MNFYTSIAKFYDYIFPFKPVQQDFVRSFHQDKGNGAFLDVGCGTGGLVSSLVNDFESLAGIDPDVEMLDLAKEKQGHGDTGTLVHKEEGVKYLELGMLDLEANFCPKTLDIITCFGNTVVHLGSEEEVQSFLYQANNVLKPGGKLLIQIINYDRIIDQKLKGLSTIENEKIKFERIYGYGENPVKVDFITKLTIKETDRVIENSVPLLALRPGTFRTLLSKAGFTKVEEFGNFKKEAFSEDSVPYVVKALK